jgi:hypothetical protein
MKDFEKPTSYETHDSGLQTSGVGGDGIAAIGSAYLNLGTAKSEAHTNTKDNQP